MSKLSCFALCFLALVLVAPDAAIAQRPGARGAVSQKFLDYAVTELAPLIEQDVSRASLPDVSGRKDRLHYLAIFLYIQ